ncbi:hypothetical protein B0A55_03486 [Friedmanniomyces simplex]|uniref:Uncharacterized protein n=1 Tax=Friedmanniomyces simplex TaxID=329884 RepID=A0A4U0XUK2_9PEZI|nr:hypothetical protein B0A55_03486 [Friedmanniomyces simplex]
MAGTDFRDSRLPLSRTELRILLAVYILLAIASTLYAAIELRLAIKYFVALKRGAFQDFPAGLTTVLVADSGSATHILLSSTSSLNGVWSRLGVPGWVAVSMFMLANLAQLLAEIVLGGVLAQSMVAGLEWWEARNHAGVEREDTEVEMV